MKIEAFPTEYTSNIRTLPYYTTKAYFKRKNEIHKHFYRNEKP